MTAILLNTLFSAIAALAGVFSVVQFMRKKRKADLSIIVLSRGGGVENVAIKNFGEADASNISISFPLNLNVIIDNEALSSATISKGQQYNISFYPLPDEKNLKCVLEWDDKAGHHNKTQSIQILLF